jgi:hypothetical protein
VAAQWISWLLRDQHEGNRCRIGKAGMAMKRPIVAAGPRRRIALGLAVAAMTGALGACGSAQASGTTDSVASAGVQVAHTALGTVGYRVIGSGPPLILIMGYAGTMETWEPQFVDTLAKRNRVVIFDNAGIGSTQALASPLTIDAMADQPSTSGRLRGDLTPECSAAVQAVLESLGRKRGPEDDRTTAQRRHDALQEACDLRMAACLMPNQAGSVSLAGGGGIRSR